MEMAPDEDILVILPEEDSRDFTGIFLRLLMLFDALRFLHVYRAPALNKNYPNYDGLHIWTTCGIYVPLHLFSFSSSATAMRGSTPDNPTPKCRLGLQAVPGTRNVDSIGH